MRPVQDCALVTETANWVRGKCWTWIETPQTVRVGELQVLIQVYWQFDIFCSENQCKWVEMFAQRGMNKRRITQQTQGMSTLGNALMTYHPLASSKLGSKTAQRSLNNTSLCEVDMPRGGKFWADINSFCVWLMKLVSKGFGALKQSFKTKKG